MRRRADPAVPLGAVLAELRDLLLRLQSSPMRVHGATEHVASNLDLTRSLQGDTSARRGSTVDRVVRRFLAAVTQIEVAAGEVPRAARCAATSDTVRDLLRDRGFEVDSVRFIGSWWPGQVVFVGMRSGVSFIRGAVVLDCKLEREAVVAFAKVRIDEVYTVRGAPE